MLWIFVLALIMPISLGSCDDTNLAQVTWAHAVNSQDELKNALANDKLQMIEADVILGDYQFGTAAVPVTKTKSNDGAEGQQAKPAVPAEAPPAQTADGAGQPAQSGAAQPDQTGEVSLGTKPGTNIPIMGHPPQTTSDLTLEQFLKEVAAYNKNATTPKGVKLDFKSLEALQAALTSWKKNDDLKNVWINADIIPGPGKKAGSEVDAKGFFDAVHAAADLKNKTLSIGWTTELEKDKKTAYEQSHIDAMIKAIEDSQIPVGYPITFPVRAAIAAESKETLHNLFDKVKENERQVTFTVWSGQNDTVDEGKLQNFIESFGVSKVYVDVPKDLQDKLNLTGGAATVVKFGLLNLAAIAIAMFFRNGLH